MNNTQKLLNAVKNNDYSAVGRLLRLNKYVHQLDSEGFSPFSRAMEKGEVELLQLYQDAKVDINVKDDNVFLDTPLHWAVTNGSKSILELLLENGADVNAKNNKDSTPLHYAANNYLASLATLLIKHGADVNAKTNCGNTPLHFAAASSNTVVAKVLLNNDADVNCKNNDGRTPLNIAKLRRDKETIRFFKTAEDEWWMSHDSGVQPMHVVKT